MKENHTESHQSGSASKSSSGRKGERKAERGTRRKHKRRQATAFTPEQLAQRAAALPVIDYPDLPVSAHRDELAKAIKEHQVVVVSGETGSGKTTQLPKICLQLGRGVSGMIGHTQPRRLAARTVAERIAAELGQTVGNELGQVVGYQVRFTDQVGPTTLVKLMTDGILLNEISFDPTLSRYDTIIVDEAHERSLNIDFILGYLTRLLPQRPDLKVIITSATIDSGKFAAHFEQALGQVVPTIEVSGRTFPVQIRYRPLAPDLALERTPGSATKPGFGATLGSIENLTPDSIENSTFDSTTGSEADLTSEIASPPVSRAATSSLSSSRPKQFGEPDQLSALGYGLGETIDVEQGLCQAALELLQETDGDILAFLPGERDIHEAQLALAEFLHEHWAPKDSPREVEIVPLFARLSAAEQQRIFASHQRRRIVLATNIAETSLTVPGIRSVIDSGLARISRFSNKTKVQRLPIEPVSQASSNQRAGRAGRVAEGVAIRLFSERDFAARAQFTEPEILRTSLAAVILQMSALHLGEVSKFPFIDPPSTRAIRDGFTQLVEIGALTVEGKITKLGRQLSRLNVDPRLGRMLLEGIHRGCGAEMAVIVGALSIQDVRERPLEHQQASDQLHARFADQDSDFVTYLNMWRYLHIQSRDLSGSAFRRMCRAEFLHFLRFREWRDVVSQLRSMCQDLGMPVPALAIPDRTAVKQVLSRLDAPESQHGTGASESRARVAVEFGLSAQTVDPVEIHRAVLVGLLSNVGNWDEKRRDFAGTHGTHFAVWPGSVLHKRHPHWVMAAELVETSRVFARTVAVVQPEWIESAAKHLVKRSFSDPFWSKSKGAAFVRERTTLYGLTLSANRPRLLSQLKNTVIGREVEMSLSSALPDSALSAKSLTAQELSREMFIRHALVLGEWRVPPVALQFVKHNRAELEKAQDLADKQRNPALVPDEWTLCNFFASRLPESINSAVTFERWWREAKQTDPHLLDLQLQDLVSADIALDEELFPAKWKQGQLALPVTYSFAPGRSEDGMTVRIPLELLGQVRLAGFDWLVPGMLLDLCTETIRALPKEKRLLLVPAPQFAKQIAEQLTPLHPLSESTGDEPLESLESLSGRESANPPIESLDSSTAKSAATKPADNPYSLAASLERLQNWGKQNGVIQLNTSRSSRVSSASQNNVEQDSPNQRGASQNGSTQCDSNKRKANVTIQSDAAQLGSTQKDDATPSNANQSAANQSATNQHNLTLQDISQHNSDKINTTQYNLSQNGDYVLSFAKAFTQACQQLFGVEISSAQVEQAMKRLPAHLQVGFAITDKRGAIVGAGADLAKLQKQFAKRADQAVSSAVKDALQTALKQQNQQKHQKQQDQQNQQYRDRASFEVVQSTEPTRSARTTRTFQSTQAAQTAQTDQTFQITQANQALHPTQKIQSNHVNSVAQSAQFSAFDQHGLTEFPETELPECVTLTRGSLSVRGYLALVAEISNEKWAVGVQIYNNRDEATQNHFAGLANLLALALELPEQRITTRWSGREALLLAASPYPTTSALVRDAQWAAAAHLLESFAADLPNGVDTIRSRPDFNNLVQVSRAKFEDCVYNLLRLVVKAVDSVATLDEAIAKILQQSNANLDLVAIAKDCRKHRNHLLKNGFLSAVPLEYLEHFARYLQADVVRLQRATRGARELDQDFARWDSLDEVWEAFQQAELSAGQRPFSLRTWLRLREIQWQLEELRVSLFAEQLGTAKRVSATRLLREIQTVERDK